MILREQKGERSMRNGMWYILCRYALWNDVIAGPFLTKEAANEHHITMMRSLAEESVIRQCNIGEQLPKEPVEENDE